MSVRVFWKRLVFELVVWVKNFCPGMVAHTIIPATWEAEIRRSWFKVSLTKKLVRLYLKKTKNWAWWYISVIPVTQEAEIGGS
jgi:hypothetical protein